MNVGLIGLGAIGRLHFACWRRSKAARLVAIAARDPRKLEGQWSGQEFNLGAQTAERVELDDLRRYRNHNDLLADPEVQLVDICLPTPLHAAVAIAALRAGKHVLCEKPMALTREECAAMEEAARVSGRLLMIAHCLRYWPEYVRARELLRSGEFGRAIYARLLRSSALPQWSSGGWLQDEHASGGVLDMHIHDIDVALWWFGRPEHVTATGWRRNGLPMIVDATWHYPGGLDVQLHGSWDPNGGPFRHAFTLVMERATLSYDLALTPPSLQLHRDGATSTMPIVEADAHQAELDDFAGSCATNEPVARVTPVESRLAVELGLEELRQISR